MRPSPPLATATAACIRRHVELYEYQPAKLHTKLAIVDDIVHIGSSNFDYRSFYINLEIMLRIKDAGFADAMRGYFERELADCKWITHDVHKRRSNPWRRFKWALSHFLVNVMDYSRHEATELRSALGPWARPCRPRTESPGAR